MYKSENKQWPQGKWKIKQGPFQQEEDDLTQPERSGKCKRQVITSWSSSRQPTEGQEGGLCKSSAGKDSTLCVDLKPITQMHLKISNFWEAVQQVIIFLNINTQTLSLCWLTGLTALVHTQLGDIRQLFFSPFIKFIYQNQVLKRNLRVHASSTHCRIKRGTKGRRRKVADSGRHLANGWRRSDGFLVL